MMVKHFKSYLLVLIGLVLLVGSIFVLWPQGEDVVFELPDFKNKLASDIEDPTSPQGYAGHGWTWEDRPVAESEEVANSIEEQLAFDEGLYRIYRYDGVSIAVWAAYWHPGKVDILDVHVHEPDSCWVHGGWQIDQRADTFHFTLPGEKQLVPAKYRLMSKHGNDVHVAFWHLVGGVNLKIDRNEGSLTKYPKIIQQTGVQSKGEQFFFRISSTHGFEDLVSDPGFRKIIRSLGDLGLWDTEVGR